jgi:hypothetical protein
MNYGSGKVLLKENHIRIYDWNHCPDKEIYKKGKFKGISLLLHTEQTGEYNRQRGGNRINFFGLEYQ